MILSQAAKRKLGGANTTGLLPHRPSPPRFGTLAHRLSAVVGWCPLYSDGFNRSALLIRPSVLTDGRNAHRRTMGLGNLVSKSLDKVVDPGFT